MPTDDTSQSQNPLSFVANLMEGQVDRVDSWLDEMQKWQKKGFDRTEDAIDEAADLSKTTLRYVERLNEEWQDLGTETMRQVLDTEKDA